MDSKRNIINVLSCCFSLVFMAQSSEGHSVPTDKPFRAPNNFIPLTTKDFLRERTEASLSKWDEGFYGLFSSETSSLNSAV